MRTAKRRSVAENLVIGAALFLAGLLAYLLVIRSQRPAETSAAAPYFRVSSPVRASAELPPLKISHAAAAASSVEGMEGEIGPRGAIRPAAAPPPPGN